MARGFYDRDRDDREYAFVGDINEPVAIFSARDFSDIEYKVDVTKEAAKVVEDKPVADVKGNDTKVANVSKKEVAPFNWSPIFVAGGVIVAALLLNGLRGKTNK